MPRRRTQNTGENEGDPPDDDMESDDDFLSEDNDNSSTMNTVNELKSC